MIENQSIIKKEKMDYPRGVDLLSDLPLSIIHIILAFVPIRDAVRTSILSRQWRYTWASLPHLVFDVECAKSKNKSIYGFEDRMMFFVSNALSHHRGPILKFEISCAFQYSYSDIDEWLLSLSRRLSQSRNDIRELVLSISCWDTTFAWWNLHSSSIYSCEKLTNLELTGCKLDPPPSTFKGFLFLRCLFLQGVCLSHNTIESLLANSPLLETFQFIDNYTRSELRICTPNLKYLDLIGEYLIGEYEEICLYAPLLVEMRVDLRTWVYYSPNHQQQKSSVCNYTNFMGGFTNLEKLSGSIYFTKYLSIGIEYCHHTLVFHHLKDIELDDVDFEDIKQISAISHLIIGAPNLNKLTIGTELDFEPSDSEALNASFKDFRCAPNFTFEKLRVVNISGDRYLPPAMIGFIEFLLERSPVLEMMSFYLRVRPAEKKKMADEIQGFSRASPNAMLSFN